MLRYPRTQPRRPRLPAPMFVVANAKRRIHLPLKIWEAVTHGDWSVPSVAIRGFNPRIGS